MKIYDKDNEAFSIPTSTRKSAIRIFGLHSEAAKISAIGDLPPDELAEAHREAAEELQQYPTKRIICNVFAEAFSGIDIIAILEQLGYHWCHTPDYDYMEYTL